MKTKMMKANGMSKTSAPSIVCEFFPEPKLLFAEGFQHIDPKLGILSSGPRSYVPRRQHPESVRVGIIGSAETIAATRVWMEQGAKGFDGNESHARFPGFMSDRGYRSNLVFDSTWEAQLVQREIDLVLSIKGQRDRFEALLALLEDKLRLLSEKDRQPEYITIAIPEQLYKACRAIDYHDKVLGRVHRDLRRAIKVIAMKFRIPTQILRQQTAENETGDVISKIYWNYFTGLYFKAGGLPWSPVGLAPGTCYIGISFFRPFSASKSKMQTSLAQAFDEHGDGLVLRGYEFEWDAEKEGSPSPHLTEQDSFRLIELILNRYTEVMGQTPQRVIVHKSSRYWDAERRGFTTALQNKVSKYALMALTTQSTFRLMTTNKYPPIRGTSFRIGDLDYLYTTGFIQELGEFHGVHVPAPIQIADHIGQDTAREALLREILVLTKMNWNSAHLGGSLPITLRFSQLVGDIMREVPTEMDPLANFKFYM
ncbi:MAG: hypothetical protein L6Q98_21930 [Anaerolineae bacterium]|nr:hypothetical protein [Anaerolineae bacterium]NUQ06297.1 hypothetical protein [Anaerolineae bacterium]